MTTYASHWHSQLYRLALKINKVDRAAFIIYLFRGTELLLNGKLVLVDS